MVLKMLSFSATLMPLLLVVLFAAANTEAACADGKPACEAEATKGFGTSFGTDATCMTSKLTGTVCTTFNALNKCLMNATCDDFKNKSTEVYALVEVAGRVEADSYVYTVLPSKCTVEKFEAYCVPPIDTDLKMACNATHKTRANPCFVQAQPTFDKLKTTTSCLLSQLTPEICGAYTTMAACLQRVIVAPCSPLSANATLVKGTKCSLKTFKDTCKPRPTIRPAPATLTPGQSGAIDLSTYTTAGYPLILLLCQIAVLLFVLK